MAYVKYGPIEVTLREDEIWTILWGLIGTLRSDFDHWEKFPTEWEKRFKPEISLATTLACAVGRPDFVSERVETARGELIARVEKLKESKTNV